MKLKGFLYFLLFVALSACKPLEDQVGNVDEPYFFLRSESPNALNLEAGKNGYYHFTLHQRDEMDVYEFVGKLSKDSCENCDEEISILFRAAHPIASGEAFQISDHIREGEYDYIQNLTLSRHRKLQFVTDTTLNVNARYLWDFGDGHTSTSKQPSHNYKQDNDYMVSLFTENGDCSTYTIKQVFVTADSIPDACEADFDFFYLSPNTVQFFPKNAKPGETYNWNFGDGLFSSDSTPIHTYSDTGKYNVLLIKLMPSLVCSSLVIKWLKIENDIPAPCNTTFSYHEAPLTVVDSMHLAKVLVTYRSKNGETFRSDVLLQDAAFFQISNVQPYENNEKGEPVIVFDLDFSCRLRNDNGAEIDFGRNRGRIGVSYPR